MYKYFIHTHIYYIHFKIYIIYIYIYNNLDQWEYLKSHKEVINIRCVVSLSKTWCESKKIHIYVYNENLSRWRVQYSFSFRQIILKIAGSTTSSTKNPSNLKYAPTYTYIHTYIIHTIMMLTIFNANFLRSIHSSIVIT